MIIHQKILDLYNANNKFIDSVAVDSIYINILGNINKYSLVNRNDLNHLIYLLTTHRSMYKEVNDIDNLNEVEELLKCLHALNDELEESNFLSKVNTIHKGDVWVTNACLIKDYPNQYLVTNTSIHELLLLLGTFCKRLPGFGFMYKVKYNANKGVTTVKIFTPPTNDIMNIIDLVYTGEENCFLIMQDVICVKLNHPTSYDSFQTILNEVKVLSSNYLVDTIKFALFKMYKNVECV